MSTTFCFEEEREKIETLFRFTPDPVTENKKLKEEVMTLQEVANQNFEIANINYGVCMTYDEKIKELTESIQILEKENKEIKDKCTKEEEIKEGLDQEITKLNNEIAQLREKVLFLNDEKEKLYAENSTLKTVNKDQGVELQDQISGLQKSDEEKDTSIQQQNEPKQEGLTEINENRPNETKKLEKRINEKKTEEAMKIIERLGGIKALTKKTNTDPNSMHWTHNPQEDDLFEVITFCNDKTCSFVVVYNLQAEMNGEEVQPYCQTTESNFSVFYLPPGIYEICAYNDQSLENIGYSKAVIN
ncbi:hypothetical protein EDI_150830 [Entamoeba dispar SAW760]|uniref:Uncharacterized protein n=1 Tax=Entamoeba dispar (strain ATCC PRA-260 / SAW760) TaxID=370354 RepID=B0EQ46_ENTDS|nr:uncharacterized protein EDI_150830 [Entamoeba dispar SAW760]EDR23334.1 hypothetical protein EDI_150830 [Entamoeba dispar SAW760]|eukprot:EDR23334.1 hypothetical protein EDI_150830 [Entamoeba dispar SAW760]